MLRGDLRANNQTLQRYKQQSDSNLRRLNAIEEHERIAFDLGNELDRHVTEASAALRHHKDCEVIAYYLPFSFEGFGQREKVRAIYKML
jgi:hypothetical protein